MTIAWHLEGIEKLDASMETITRLVESATRVAVTQSAHLIEAEAKSGFGPIHVKGTPKTVFDKPQSVSGNLRRSIETKPTTQFGSVFTGRVEAGMIYARRIELGFTGSISAHDVREHERRTPSGGMTTVQAYVQPDYDVTQRKYPFMRPGVRRALPQMQRVFDGAWARAVGSI